MYAFIWHHVCMSARLSALQEKAMLECDIHVVERWHFLETRPTRKCATLPLNNLKTRCTPVKRAKKIPGIVNIQNEIVPCKNLL